MSKLLNFLRNNPENWYSILKSPPYNLFISTDGGELWLFKYNQIESDMSNEIVQECRGIILSKKNNEWTIVCKPFTKFFNYGEPLAFDIDINCSIVYEKVDGSLLKMYYYNNEWIVATNGTINSKYCETRIPEKTFYDLFIDVVGDDGFEQMKNRMNKNDVYLFELVHPLSRIVVDYKDKKELVFIGHRYSNGIEHIPTADIFDGLDFIRLPKIYERPQKIEELIEIADNLNVTGVDFEGFVVTQVNEYNDVVGRVKVKSPKYLKYHHLAGSSIYNSMMELILKNEIDEFNAYLSKAPYYIVQIYNDMRKCYNDFIEKANSINKIYMEKAKTMSRKEIAIDINTNVEERFRPFVFAYLYKNLSIHQILSKKSAQMVRKIINYKPTIIEPTN